MTTRVQDFYKATITRNWTATTGDFNISVAPTITEGIIVISPNSTTQREIVRYTATGTNQYGPFVTISDVADRGLSGTTAQSHIIGEQVRMNVTAVHWDELLADAVAPTVDIGTTTTLEPGSDATVTNSGDTINATLDFEIPAGSTIYSGTSIPDNSVGRNGDWAFDTSVNSYVWYKSGDAWDLVNSLKGATGDGNGIASIVLTETVGLVDTYTITYDDDTTTTFNVTNGAKGEQGDAGISVVSIIKTNTVGLVDTYTITYSNETISTFDVINGAKGDTGDAATISVGTVTTLDAGSAVTVVNSGTENAAVFDFGIPEGDKGDTGDIGIEWQGAWSAGTYTITQAVSHNGSSWIATTTTTEEPSISATDWDLIALKGTDGTGTGDISGSGVENEIAYFTAEKTIDNLPVATYPSLTELSYVKGVTSGIQTQLGDKAPTASPTFTGTVTTPAIKITTGAGLGKVLTSNADGDATWETPSAGGGASLWTAITGTRASNTTITVAGDQTAIFKKGMVVRWQESGVDKVGMVSIPSTYSSPNTTITIIGNVCASIDTDTFKYSTMLLTEKMRFAVAGNIGTVATNVANARYADKPYHVIGAEIAVGTSGTTNNTTVDINKAGTTMFTTKPTLATTVAFATTPFTADTATALALGDKVTLDIDAVQTTNAVDLYVDLLVFESRFLTLS